MKGKGYVLITGGGSGLGKSLAMQFANIKYPVVIVGRTRNKLEMVKAECGEDSVLTIVKDVSKYDNVEDCFKIANDWAGYPKIVISCAGQGVFGQVGCFRDEHIMNVMSGSLYGTIFVSQKAFIEMQGMGGVIINVISTAATMGKVNESIYCAAKWGAKGFTESLRLESKGTKVRVIAVYPGGIDTPFWDANPGILHDTAGYMNSDELAKAIVENVLDKKSFYVSDMIFNRII
ncbi:MAG: SDR family NAD(P)-dependent oxidoreductase [Chlorobaculum sp.]|nr:SDR family NAD(P)-dependent oxidoreductase [Chlorobaculum sp.]